MLQLAGDPDLAPEPLPPHGGGEVGIEQFECDLGARPVVREEDRGHAAAAQLALDGVAA